LTFVSFINVLTQVREIVTSSVVFPVRTFYIEQMFVSVRMQFHNHGDCRHTTSETFRQGCAMYIRYQIWNVCKCARLRFHCSNDLVVLRSCTEHLVTRES